MTAKVLYLYGSFNYLMTQWLHGEGKVLSHDRQFCMIALTQKGGVTSTRLHFINFLLLS